MQQNYGLSTIANTPFVGVFTVGRHKMRTKAGKRTGKVSVTDENLYLYGWSVVKTPTNGVLCFGRGT